MDEREVNDLRATAIRAGVPLDVGRGTKDDLVLIHEEQRRLKGLHEALQRSAKVLAGVRSALEVRLGLEHHEWDFDDAYDPDDPTHEERRTEKEVRKREGGPGDFIRSLLGG